jgi:anti-anti-sigma regulatory factor
VRIRRQGGDLRLAGLSQRSAHLMEITKLATVFATYDSDTSAVRSFSAG